MASDDLIKNARQIAHDYLRVAVKDELDRIRTEKECQQLSQRLRDFVRGDPVTAKLLGVDALMDQWLKDQELVCDLFSVAATLYRLWLDGRPSAFGNAVDLSRGCAERMADIIKDCQERWGERIDQRHANWIPELPDATKYSPPDAEAVAIGELRQKYMTPGWCWMCGLEALPQRIYCANHIPEKLEG